MQNPYSIHRIMKPLKKPLLKIPLGRFLLKFYLVLAGVKQTHELIKTPEEVYDLCKNVYAHLEPAASKLVDQYITAQLPAVRVHENSDPFIYEGTSVVTAGTNFTFKSKA